MNTHKNARLTPKGREAMVRAVVDRGLSKTQVARQFNASAKTVAKWAGRFRQHGVAGLADRSSRPLSSPARTSLETPARVAAMRRMRFTGQQIARDLDISPATVSRVLARMGLNLLSSLDPKPPRPRYERETPGEIIHIDIKKLGRFNRIGHRITGVRNGQSKQRQNGTAPGWEFAHVAIDDHSRVARIDIFPDERKKSAIAFLKATVAFYRALGVRVDRVMTDNGSCYKSFAFARACKRLGIKHIRTKPYTPQTNGKAERFIQTALREWAYATAYETSDHRRADLTRWIHRYNWHRPHASLGQKPPITRLGLTGDNLLRHHS